MPSYFYARTRESRETLPSQRVLVALTRTPDDWRIVREEGWYRIPVKSAPPLEFGHLAFYHGNKNFGDEAWSVRWRAQVGDVKIMRRREMFPDQSTHPRADQEYYKISISDLKPTPQPITSLRERFIVFVSTTLNKLEHATEFNDLFHSSPLGDELWDNFKQQKIEAERQWFLTANRKRYCLDFAIFCAKGGVNVECDGDACHLTAKSSSADNARNNALTSKGWAILRFNTQQITQELPDCLKSIRETVKRRGGVLTACGQCLRLYNGSGHQKQKSLF